jgi:hypothetical protein
MNPTFERSERSVLGACFRANERVRELENILQELEYWRKVLVQGTKVSLIRVVNAMAGVIKVLGRLRLLLAMVRY